MRGSWFSILKALKESSNPLGGKLVHDVGSKGFSSMPTWRDVFNSRITESVKKVAIESTHLSKVTTGAGVMTKDILKADAGSHVLFRGSSIRESRLTLLNPHQFSNSYLGRYPPHPCYSRSLTSSSASQSSGQTQQQQPRKDISKVDDPFDDAPTYNIPEKPMTFVEGASYSVVILAGLGFAAAAAYMACKELLFQPKEYKVFGIALERIQNDHQVRARIGSPIKGYGRETRNRAARQQIPNKAWTDEGGVERVMINFIIRGPHGYGEVIADMFKDKEDKKWKFTYLVVDIKSPSPVQLMLESYLPA